jgi:hypothetical protein
VAEAYDLDTVVQAFFDKYDRDSIPVILTEAVDDAGEPFMVLNFSIQNHEKFVAGKPEVAKYLLELRHALISAGARTTFNVYDEDTE